jgi:hypothetical protein
MKIIFYQLDSLLHELQQKKDVVRDHLVRIDKHKELIDPIDGWDDKYWLYVVVSAAVGQGSEHIFEWRKQCGHVWDERNAFLASSENPETEKIAANIERQAREKAIAAGFDVRSGRYVMDEGK